MPGIAECAEGFWTIADWRRHFPGSCRDWNVRFIYQGPNPEGQRAWWVYLLVDQSKQSWRREYFRGVVLA